MSHANLGDARFWRLLTELDRDHCAQVRREGCPHCSGVLHAARYRRKPRGAPRALLGEAYEYRESLCCSREGCRRRCTPESVRFLGRRVYLGAWLVLLSALLQDLPARARQRMCERLGVAERTLLRWRQWWRKAFVHSALWSMSKARFTPPVALEGLPLSLLSRFGNVHEGTTLVAMLTFLKPLSSGRSNHVI